MPRPRYFNAPVQSVNSSGKSIEYYVDGVHHADNLQKADDFFPDVRERQPCAKVGQLLQEATERHRIAASLQQSDQCRRQQSYPGKNASPNGNAFTDGASHIALLAFA